MLPAPLRVLGAASHVAIGTAAAIGRALPIVRRDGVEVIRDVPYRGTGRRAHLLDVYRPIGATSAPCVLYVHGGGFGILTKDSHWFLALVFARRGYTVFNISYRLAPAEPYPAAIDDACAAYAWIVHNARDFGGDPARLVLAGDSAGGNLVASLALAACYRRDEAFARGVWDTGVVPRAVAPASAVFQVSDLARLWRRRSLPRPVTWILGGVERGYLGGARGSTDLADPVCVLERGEAPARPLPPFFAAVGTRDPLLDDTRRLEAALRRLGGRCEARYYAGEIHVFHAALWRRAARAYWRELFGFLATPQVGAGGTAARGSRSRSSRRRP